MSPLQSQSTFIDRLIWLCCKLLSHSLCITCTPLERCPVHENAAVHTNSCFPPSSTSNTSVHRLEVLQVWLAGWQVVSIALYTYCCGDSSAMIFLRKVRGDVAEEPWSTVCSRVDQRGAGNGCSDINLYKRWTSPNWSRDQNDTSVWDCAITSYLRTRSKQYRPANGIRLLKTPRPHDTT